MNQAVRAEAVTASAPLPQDRAIAFRYVEALRLVERLHHRLIELVKDELERRGEGGVNAVQALLLYNVGDQELSATELLSRGCYLGSNVSYNVKKLVEGGFLHYARSAADRRSVRVSLTGRGREVRLSVQALYDRQAHRIASIGGLSEADFEGLNRSLARLERFWRDQARSRL